MEFTGLQWEIWKQCPRFVDVSKFEVLKNPKGAPESNWSQYDTLKSFQMARHIWIAIPQLKFVLSPVR